MAKQWWERSAKMHFRKKKDKKDYQKETAEFIKSFQKDKQNLIKKRNKNPIQPLLVGEYLKQFQEDVKKKRKKILKNYKSKKEV